MATKQEIDRIKDELQFHDSLTSLVRRYQKNLDQKKKRKNDKDKVDRKDICDIICPILSEELGG